MAGKTDLTAHVAEVSGVTKAQANQVVDATIDFISKALVGGDKVTLPGLGTFAVSERAAREGRNPATGAKMRIPASKGVRFKPGKDLKDSLNR